jgi:hypothetical protein
MKRKSIKIGFFASLSVLLLSGCGAQKFQTNSGGLTSGSSTLGSTSAAAAKCSHDIDNLANLSTRLKVYEDGTSGIRNDLIRVKFNRFPTEFTNATDAVKLWTRTVDGNGTWGAWHTVSFYVERYTTNGIVRSPYKYSDLTWAQMQQLGSFFGVPATTASEFLNSVVLLAELGDLNVAKVLTTKVYMSATSPEVTTLIPQFKANPREYAKDHPQALLDLHPLAYLWNNNYTEDQYAYEANQFCF